MSVVWNVRNRTVHRAKNKRMFRMSVMWFIFNLQRRECIFLTHNMVGYKCRNITLLLRMVALYTSGELLPLLTPCSVSTAPFLAPFAQPLLPPFFSPSRPHIWTLTTPDNINMPGSSSVGHTPLLMLAESTSLHKMCSCPRTPRPAPLSCPMGWWFSQWLLRGTTMDTCFDSPSMLVSSHPLVVLSL